MGMGIGADERLVELTLPVAHEGEVERQRGGGLQRRLATETQGAIDVQPQRVVVRRGEQIPEAHATGDGITQALDVLDAEQDLLDARNARVATADLGTLRAEVEASLRKVESLVTEINRKWPFARDTEIKLP